MKIIIADTSVSARSRVISTIQERFWTSEFLPCVDVQETMEMCSCFKPDVIFLSANLLGGNPMDILPEIERAKIEPLVVVCVDPAFPMVKQQFLNAGVHHVVEDAADFTTILEQHRYDTIASN